MGRTVPTYRMYLESILDRWMDYRRALREKDRELFDEVMNRTRQHASAATYCAHLDPVETAFLSIFLEMQRDIAELRGRLNGEPLGDRGTLTAAEEHASDA